MHGDIPTVLLLDENNFQGGKYLLLPSTSRVSMKIIISGLYFIYSLRLTHLAAVHND